MQHRSSPPHCENAILKGCNISLVWFQEFFDLIHTNRGSVLFKPVIRKLSVVSLSRSKVIWWAAQDLLSVPPGLKANVLHPFAILGCVLTFIFIIGFPFWFWVTEVSIPSPLAPCFTPQLPPTVDRSSLLEDPQCYATVLTSVANPAPFADLLPCL